MKRTITLFVILLSLFHVSMHAEEAQPFFFVQDAKELTTPKSTFHSVKEFLKKRKIPLLGGTLVGILTACFLFAQGKETPETKQARQEREKKAQRLEEEKRQREEQEKREKNKKREEESEKDALQGF